MRQPQLCGGNSGSSTQRHGRRTNNNETQRHNIKQHVSIHFKKLRGGAITGGHGALTDTLQTWPLVNAFFTASAAVDDAASP